MANTGKYLCEKCPGKVYKLYIKNGKVRGKILQQKNKRENGGLFKKTCVIKLGPNKKARQI